MSFGHSLVVADYRALAIVIMAAALCAFIVVAWQVHVAACRLHIASVDWVQDAASGIGLE